MMTRQNEEIVKQIRIGATDCVGAHTVAHESESIDCFKLPLPYFTRIIHVVLTRDTLLRGPAHLVRFGLSSNSAWHFNAGRSAASVS